MGSLIQTGLRKKRWRARCKRDGVEYFLGVFDTKEQAQEREQEFNKDWPAKPGYREGWNYKHG